MMKELLAPLAASLGCSPCPSQKTPRSFHPTEHFAAPSLPAQCWRSALSITYVLTHKYLSLQGNSSSCLAPLGSQGGNAVCPLFRIRPGDDPGWFFGQAAGCGVKDGMPPSPVISGRL